MSIKVLIDSASDISKKEADELGISLIPMIVNIDNEEYYDGVDLLPKEFYKNYQKQKIYQKQHKLITIVLKKHLNL